MNLSFIKESKSLRVLLVVLFLMSALSLSWLVGTRNQALRPEVDQSQNLPSKIKGAGSLPTDLKQLEQHATTQEKAPGETLSTPEIKLPSLVKIIKTASLTLKVKKGKFNQVYDQVLFLATTNGGYLAGSNSYSTTDHLVAGTLTLRLPADNFERVLSKLKKLGKLQNIDVSSQDVSQEFVDLESRLRSWRAQESLLLALMEKATTIQDSIAIQNQLAQVQQEIEQIVGRLNFLKDQTSFSSIQVTITETGIVPRPLDKWGFKEAVNQAAHAFVNTINGAIIILGYVTPLLLLAGLGMLIYRIAVRRRIVVT